MADCCFKATIFVKPTGKARPRMARNGNVFTPKATRFAEQNIRWALLKFGPVPASGPVALDIRMFMLRAKSAKREHPTVKPDLDNCLKLVCDAANGILFDDDKQVCEVVVGKYYGETERIEIRMTCLSSPCMHRP